VVDVAGYLGWCGVTAGREALVEAMRLEQARIYGACVRESRPARPQTVRSERSESADVLGVIGRLRAERWSIAAIAIRLGVPRGRVTDIVHRLEEAS
jgi:hypothetical protein